MEEDLGHLFERMQRQLQIVYLTNNFRGPQCGGAWQGVKTSFAKKFKFLFNFIYLTLYIYIHKTLLPVAN